MMHIRPVSDLRNKFPEVEKIAESGEPVFLTKNGYGSMVLLSLEQYSKMTECLSPDETADSTINESEVSDSAQSTPNGLFKSKKKGKKQESPANPELQREAEEQNLGKHTMLDHKVLPLPPNANGFRI